MSTPKIRFKGFTDDWEQWKFEKCYKVSAGYAFKYQDYCGNGIGLVNGESIQHGFIDDSNINYLPLNYREEYSRFLLHEGDIVVGLNRPITNGKLKIAKVPKKLDGALLYQRAGKIEYKSRIDEKFSFIVLSKEILDYTLKEAIGSDQPFISTSKLNKWVMTMPSSFAEQKKIGEYLSNIDIVISLHQQKSDELQKVKKYMLQKMFPKKGEKVPEIRFAGFTDDWEQRKLGDMIDVTSVKRIHQSDWTNSGVRFLRARDIVAESKNEEVTEPLFISQEKYNEYSAISGKVKIGDLLVTGVGTIGVPMLIKDDEPLYFKDGNIIWFKNDKIDGKFFYYSFIGTSIQKYIKESAGIGTVGTYTIDSGKNTPIVLPTQKDEQKKIGEYFSNFDNLIALHQRKHDTLKEIKKYMLQNMFPKE